LENFLEKTAKYLYQKYQKQFSDICIVLPNKRASLFLKKYLSTTIQKPIWLPKIIGAEEFIENISHLEIIDSTHQIFELYQIYIKKIKEPEPFEEFIKWGQTLLHDFNEIDRYLVNTDKIFNHINEARILEIWNLGEREITPIENQYLQFWKEIGNLYQLYKDDLLHKEKAYQGLAFRSVTEKLIENPSQFIEEKIPWKKIIFIGFNALNKAEETIISTLINYQKAEILWDVDKFYLEDEAQESGFFVRKYFMKTVFNPVNWISDKFKTSTKKINILGIPQNIGQAKYLSNILNNIKTTDNFKDTAIVLGDENLLIPVLQSIPEDIDNINVTMGYPLKFLLICF